MAGQAPPSKARFAAATAASTSALSPRAMRAQAAPVYGFSVGSQRPDAAGMERPST